MNTLSSYPHFKDLRVVGCDHDGNEMETTGRFLEFPRVGEVIDVVHSSDGDVHQVPIVMVLWPAGVDKLGFDPNDINNWLPTLWVDRPQGCSDDAWGDVFYCIGDWEKVLKRREEESVVTDGPFINAAENGVARVTPLAVGRTFLTGLTP